MNWSVLLPLGASEDPLAWMESSASSPLALGRSLMRRYGGSLQVVGYGKEESPVILQWVWASGIRDVWHLTTADLMAPEPMVEALLPIYQNRDSTVILAASSRDVVPGLLAASLGWTLVPEVRAVSVGVDERVMVRQGRRGGWQADLRLGPPLVLLLDCRFFEPLYLTVRQRQQALVEKVVINRRMVRVEARERVMRPYRRLAVKGASSSARDARTRLGALLQTPSEPSKRAKRVEGTTDEAVRAILEFLVQQGLI
ncbi:MAG: hypothetical protein OWU33_04075 [Firmicutes bacterium]|nr:hypothetical protein [Bacillota bacterium]